MDSGWIKINRKLLDSDIWKSEAFSRGQAFVDLLMLANHRDGYYRARGVRITVRRGQVGRSKKQLSERWRWSDGKVERFLRELRDDATIEYQKNNVSTLITIINYEQYQSDGNQTETKRKPNGNQIATQTETNKNEKNDKKKKNIIGAFKENALQKPKSNASPRGHRLPDGWVVSDELGHWAMQKGLDRKKVIDEADKFRLYWANATGRGAAKLDWNKAFQTWVLNHLDWSKKNE